MLHNPAREQPFRYDMLAWFSLVHVLAGVALWYLCFVQWSTATVVMAGVLFFLCHLSITMGPHRLYSHLSYKAHPSLEVVLVLLFSATFQSSVLWWAAHHMRHHSYSDTERDPYTVRHGFWWAHVVWMLHTSDDVPPEGRRLVQNNLLLWQHKNHLIIGLVVGLLLPTALGALWGDWLGGLLVGGFLRLVVQYHGTWAINSVAHSFGPWRYSSRITARACYWVLAFTVGEWNHEGHHHASADYRLGNRRWYDIDPGKWVIWLLQYVGATYDLKRVSDEEFDARIRRSAA